MARPAKFEVTNSPRGWVLNIPATFSASGRRMRLYFEKRKDAEARANELRKRSMTYGQAAAGIHPSLAEDATLAASILKPWGVSLADAARIVAAMREAEAESIPLAEAADAWLDYCRDDGPTGGNLRPRTLQGYSHTKARLVARLGDRLLTSITADDIAKAIMPKGTPGPAAHGHLRTTKAFWRWSAAKGWCDASIVDAITPPRKRTDGEIEVLTVDEAEHLLRVTEKHHPELVAHYALALFGGIRAEEIQRLTAADVSPEGIELSAKITKKGRRRHITPNFTLAAWLTKYPFRPCGDWKRVDSKIRFLAGWRVRPLDGTKMTDAELETFDDRSEWPQNALRHSHASYAVAAGADINTLLFQFGHTAKPDVLRAHYVGRVSVKEAVQFYQIAPAGMKLPIAHAV